MEGNLERPILTSRQQLTSRHAGYPDIQQEKNSIKPQIRPGRGNMSTTTTIHSLTNY